MLAEKLGYTAEDKLLIVNADDFGMCQSANAAIEKLLLERVISSATVMVPCPWAKQAAAFSQANPQLDIGIHLTFTSEWEGYKWGAVSRQHPVPSLLVGGLYFPEDCKTFEVQADPEDVRKEVYAQIEQGIALGITPTHIDVHMGSLYGLATGRDFLEIVIEACARYRLPLRLPRRIEEDVYPPEIVQMAKARIQLADELGVFMIDDLVSLPYAYLEGDTYMNVRLQMADILRNLRPGVSEMIIHPAYVTDELQGIMPHAQKRGMEAKLFRDEKIKQVLAQEHIHRITWRDLMIAQRQS
jgi:hypothetical protein